MALCCILLSIYNGEKYLMEQLESIHKQKTDVDIMYFIRDDGSVDGSEKIVEKFRHKFIDANIRYIKDDNIGVHKCFIRLMDMAPRADYYAFCDQDDYWKSNKIQSAINRLSFDTNVPALYYSNFEITNENLVPYGVSNIASAESSRSAIQILLQNRVPGCTMVFNRELLDKVNRLHLGEVRMHDAYILLIAYLFGNIYFDNIPRIYYRQHSSNSVGYRKKKLPLITWIKEKTCLLKKGEVTNLMATITPIIEIYSDELSPEKKMELVLLCNYKKSFFNTYKLIISNSTRSKDNWRATISIKIKLLFHLI